jgi:hypothetical protein
MLDTAIWAIQDWGQGRAMDACAHRAGASSRRAPELTTAHRHWQGCVGVGGLKGDTEGQTGEGREGRRATQQWRAPVRLRRRERETERDEWGEADSLALST